MTGSRLRVFWICGAAGAGKSAAAWGLFNDIAAAGFAAHVDIDQLGMLHPATHDDPDRHALKSAALDAMIPGYVAAGAQLLIVSGVVDVHNGPAVTADVELTLCLLLPGRGALRERILARGGDEAEADEAVNEDALLREAHFIDVTIKASGLSIADTVARLRLLVDNGGRVGEWTRTSDVAFESIADPGVVLITGPRAVGTSTIGFGLAMRRWRAGVRTGFVDLQQLGFLSRRGGGTGTDTTLAINQLTAMHQLMAERGAEHLVVSGHLDVPDRITLRAAFPRARVTVVRLRADAATLEEHMRARVKGSAARLAGDDLLDADPKHQTLVVATALAEQQALDGAAADVTVLDVSRRTPADVIAEIQTLQDR